LLELLELLHNSIALSNRRKIGKISQLVGSLLESGVSLLESGVSLLESGVGLLESGVSLLESLREECEIRLRTELRHRLRRNDGCHGFESWEYDSGS
jgi:hypothetical protein